MNNQSSFSVRALLAPSTTYLIFFIFFLFLKQKINARPKSYVQCSDADRQHSSQMCEKKNFLLFFIRYKYSLIAITISESVKKKCQLIIPRKMNHKQFNFEVDFIFPLMSFVSSLGIHLEEKLAAADI